MRATPGPWEVGVDGHAGAVYEVADQRIEAVMVDGEMRTFRPALIALVYERYGLDGEKPTEGGNARLVAEAPALLETCKKLFRLAMPYTLADMDTIDDARNLLRSLEDDA